MHHHGTSVPGGAGPSSGSRGILIPASRLDRAIKTRSLIAVVAAGAIVVGWCTHLTGGWVVSFVCALDLFVLSAIALRWKRERGMWMAYIFFGGVALGLWVYLSFGELGPSPQSTKRQIARDLQDAALSAWLCMLQARMMASAAVCNYRLFRRDVPASPYEQAEGVRAEKRMSGRSGSDRPGAL